MGNVFSSGISFCHRIDLLLKSMVVQQIIELFSWAFAKSKVGYLVKTTHPKGSGYEQDKVKWRKSLKAHCQNTQFVGLKILATSNDSPTTATVTFHASLIQNGRDASFTEKSLFETTVGEAD